MRQFRDNYSGALIIPRSPEEKKSNDMLEEMKRIRDEIQNERKQIEELKRGDKGEKQSKTNSSK